MFIRLIQLSELERKLNLAMEVIQLCTYLDVHDQAVPSMEFTVAVGQRQGSTQRDVKAEKGLL